MASVKDMVSLDLDAKRNSRPRKCFKTTFKKICTIVQLLICVPRLASMMGATGLGLKPIRVRYIFKCPQNQSSTLKSTITMHPFPTGQHCCCQEQAK